MNMPEMQDSESEPDTETTYNEESESSDEEDEVHPIPNVAFDREPKVHRRKRESKDETNAAMVYSLSERNV